MIKKMRMRLIFAAILSLFAVLTLIISIASIINYNTIVSNAEKTLAILETNDGQFPESKSKPEEELNMNSPLKSETFSENSFTFDENPKENPRGSAELPFESRFFSVFVDSDYNVTKVNIRKIASIDSQTAVEYTKKVLSTHKNKGFYKDFRYIVYSVDTETHLIFLDCGRTLYNFHHFVFTSIIVSIIGLIAVFILLIIVSKRVVQPFAESYEKQRRFITDAGHELKTPLTIINADTEILEMDFGNNEWMNDIKTQTKRLSDLTNNLILLSRMEEEQPQIQMIDFSLSDVAKESIEDFEALAKVQHKELTFSIEPNLSFRGDEKSIKQLINILLDNAMKYSNENGTISVTLKKQKNHIELDVYNTTKHIEREKLAHLFDRFYRTDSSRNSSTGGYGLGLSIAAAIVAAHKGKINATTIDEKSLTIRCLL